MEASEAMKEALAIFGPSRFETAHCLRYLGLSAMGQESVADAGDTERTETVETPTMVRPADRSKAVAKMAELRAGVGHVRMR